jgi:hypothetical protein
MPEASGLEISIEVSADQNSDLAAHVIEMREECDD